MGMLFFDLIYAVVHLLIFFFFNDTATTEIYTLSLHDALPICRGHPLALRVFLGRAVQLDEVVIDRADRVDEDRLAGEAAGLDLFEDRADFFGRRRSGVREGERSEEHTSELQSHSDLVCRLLLE